VVDDTVLGVDIFWVRFCHDQVLYLDTLASRQTSMVSAPPCAKETTSTKKNWRGADFETRGAHSYLTSLTTTGLR
jgi:hypothetical protein